MSLAPCQPHLTQKPSCSQVSNYRSNQDLDEYLKAQGVMGIADVDTRAITRRLRTNGCLNGVITTDESLTDEELIAKTRVRAIGTSQSHLLESLMSQSQGVILVLMLIRGSNVALEGGKCMAAHLHTSLACPARGAYGLLALLVLPWSSS